MTFLLILSLAVLAYVYGGYLVLLRAIVWLRGPRQIAVAPITPPVSLVISAYNEADVIAAKLDNALSLDYPAGQLQIVVVSDASSDATDAIVRGYATRGVTLYRQQERAGKTAGLNAIVPLLTGDIVVFSDANAMYEPDAIRKLARNFADPQVGCATGEARYRAGDDAMADVSERAYWGYEMQVKRLETALGSMVGGDGAIYAIRRSLWRTLPVNAINDFLNPLQIVAAGWRGVYEPDAVCYEETAGTIRAEYRRRVRIVSRSWRAVFQAREVLNPLRVGLFAWCVVSHKLLRWLSGLFAVTAAVSFAALALQPLAEWTGQVVASAVLVGAAAACVPRGRRTIAMAAYFSVIIGASVVGVVKGTSGQVSGVWTTPRAASVRPRRLVRIGQLFLAAGISLVTASVGGVLFANEQHSAAVLFWVSVALLGYIYVGYPAILALLQQTMTRPSAPAAVEPSVCLFIAANDEETVIEAKLHNALALDYPSDRLDIVVASDGSVDGTEAIVARFAPRVRLLSYGPRRGKVAVINEGMRTVSSEIVVFSDANTFLEPSAVRALVRRFGEPQVGAVSGDVMLEGERAALGFSEDIYYHYERWIQRAESAIGSMIGVDGALYAIRRELFVPPVNDTILDDMAIPMAVVRAGKRVVFEEQARAHEQGSESAREEFARKSRVVAGAVQFLSRTDSSVPLDAVQVAFSLVSHKALRWLSPALGGCAFIASLVLAGTSPWYAAAAMAQGVLLVCGVAGCYPVLRRTGVIALAHYFCLVQAAAAIGFLRGISGSQSVRWRRFHRSLGVVAR